MIIFIHVMIAVSSLVWSGVSYIAPSRTKLRFAYGLVAATLISGTYLVVSTHAPLVSSCVTGLTYLAVAITGLFAAERKLSV